jgi:hypothetical protein
MPRADGPSVAYRVPRHRWPEAWLRLHTRGATFTTTRCDPLPGGHVDVLVRPADASLLGDLGERMPATRDPWPGPLPARAGADLWPRLGAVGQLPNPPRDWAGDELAAAVLEALEANA